jgi:glycosyltransferase involved in cell wall biosynthesis
MREVVSRYPNTVLALVGEGPEKTKIGELIDSLDLARNVLLLPATFDERTLSMWFRSARAVVCGGQIGLLAHHALAYGTPVIAHDDFLHQCPEVESVVHNETGLIYSCGNERSLVEALIYAIANPGEMGRMGRLGRCNAVEKYSLENKVARFSDAIQELVSQARPAAGYRS